MVFDPNQPYKNVDGVNINLTAQEISDLQTQQASWSTQSVAQRLVTQAQNVLAKSDEVMLRIAEAVALGNNSWTNTDVVAFVNYRRALRAIIANGTGSMPARPAFPTGT